jgi:chromosome segregation ATPase
MWQEIELISGVPFPRGSQRRGSSGVYTNADEDLEFDSANLTQACHGHGDDVARLQRDLLVATNHATAAEIESGTERERNRVLEEENALLREDLRELTDNLQARMLELNDKDAELDRASKVIESIQTDIKQAEDQLLSRVSTLESDLSHQKAKEEQLRSEHSKALQELEKLRLRNTVQEERIQHLQDNLRDTAQTSKQRENNATIIAHAEAKHSLQILEAKLQNANEQLSKAEERERHLSIRADEARQEALSTHQNMHSVIESVRKEMSALHSIELEKLKIALESAKHQITNLTEQLHQQRIRLVNETDMLTKNNAETERRIEKATHELEGQIARCRSLQTELDQVRIQCLHVPLNYNQSSSNKFPNSYDTVQ